MCNTCLCWPKLMRNFNYQQLLWHNNNARVRLSKQVLDVFSLRRTELTLAATKPMWCRQEECSAMCGRPQQMTCQRRWWVQVQQTSKHLGRWPETASRHVNNMTDRLIRRCVCQLKRCVDLYREASGMAVLSEASYVYLFLASRLSI